MEENVAKLFREQLPSVHHLTGELFQNKTPKPEDWEDEIPKQGAPELAGEEEALRIYLDKLKKENFTLRTSIKAWQTTLETKLDEFKQADLKLEELYNEIWSERERFCSRLEKFNDEYGILSEWWDAQVRFVTGKTSEEQNGEEEIEKLEKEIGELKKEIEELQGKKRETEGGPTSPRKASNYPKVTKKVKFSEVVEEYNVGKTGEDPPSGLYSVVDLEKHSHLRGRIDSITLKSG